MMIKFFSSGIGGGSAPVDYLISREVLAYDENRNIIFDEIGQPETIIRDPLPEVVRGIPDITRDIIDASPNKWTYTAGVIAFHEDDNPSKDQQQEVIDLFEELAFSGLESNQFDCLWVRHVHEGNVELHFCTPRIELTEEKSLNIAPPNHEHTYNTLRDMLNKQHNWADPAEPQRSQSFKPVRESAERAEAREMIILALQDQIDAGIVVDRASMIAFFNEAGFEITRKSEKSISVRDPEFTKPFKLEGSITHEQWTADNGREAGGDEERARRLDQFSNDELRERYTQTVERRAEYNSERYGRVHEQNARQPQNPSEPDRQHSISLEMGDPDTDHRADSGRHSNQHSLELANEIHGIESDGADQIRSEWSNLLSSQSEKDKSDGMLFRKQQNSMSESERLNGKEINEHRWSDGVRARIDELRGTVEQRIERFSQYVRDFKEAIDGFNHVFIGKTFGISSNVNLTSIRQIVERAIEQRSAQTLRDKPTDSRQIQRYEDQIKEQIRSRDRGLER